jgi:hypothetical protein
LFAALEVATGQVGDACYPRHRHQEFLKFLKKVAAAWPGRELHVVSATSTPPDACNDRCQPFVWTSQPTSRSPRIRKKETSRAGY